MRKSIKKIIATVLTAAMAMTVGMPAFAEGNNFENLSSEDVYQYLLDRGVAGDKLDVLNDEILESTMRQAEANNFTDTQVQQYIDGQVSIVTAPQTISHEDAVLSEDGSTFITSHGEYPNLLQRYKSQYTGENIGDEIESNRSVTSWTTKIDAEDQTGVFWKVQSAGGYTSATAFATLPLVSNYNSIDRPYMFLAANSTESGACLTFVGDYGVVYNNGAWHPFINANQWDDTLHAYKQVCGDWPSTKLTTNYIYLHLRVVNEAATDRVYFEILDGNDFSKVIYSNAIAFPKNPVNASASNLNLYHETTLAQVHEKNVPLNTNTGTWMQNAKLSNAYLYNSSVTTQWGTTQTDWAGKQAPTNNKLKCVSVNDYAKWYYDNISIRFNVN